MAAAKKKPAMKSGKSSGKGKMPASGNCKNCKGQGKGMKKSGMMM